MGDSINVHELANKGWCFIECWLKGWLKGEWVWSARDGRWWDIVKVCCQDLVLDVGGLFK